MSSPPGPPPRGAAEVFGARLPLAVEYAGLLATTGVAHGLIGPREVPRIWERHILNCAVVDSLIPEGAHVVDLGSGAGLPGIPLALARTDLHVELLEPLSRRTRWLERAVSELNLTDVVVRRARAQDRGGPLVSVVVARAVAGLSKLAAWTLPWLDDGASLLALKGQAAADEVDASYPELRRLGVGAGNIEVLHVGRGIVDPPTTVVRITRPIGWTSVGR